MGKVGERGQVARWERWGREVRWQVGKDGGGGTGGSVNRVGIGWTGSGERLATGHGCYHVD